MRSLNLSLKVAKHDIWTYFVLYFLNWTHAFSLLSYCFSMTLVIKWDFEIFRHCSLSFNLCSTIVHNIHATFHATLTTVNCIFISIDNTIKIATNHRVYRGRHCDNLTPHTLLHVALCAYECVPGPFSSFLRLFRRLLPYKLYWDLRTEFLPL